MYMSEKQLDVLNAVARATEGNNSLLDENQRRILLGIIEEYTKPKTNQMLKDLLIQK